MSTTKSPRQPPSADAELDALLAEFVSHSDEDAMAELVRRTRPRLLGAARRIGDPQDAEDSVQAAYHALLRRASTVPDGPVIAWLLTATIRIAFRRKASRRSHSRLVERLAARHTDAISDPSSTVSAADDANAVRAAVTRLPDLYRDALVLHYLHGLSVAEVAQLLDVPVSTTTTRLQRGRKLLRSRLPASLHFGAFVLPWRLRDACGDFVGSARASLWRSGAFRPLFVVGVGLIAMGTAAALLVDTTGPRADAEPRATEHETDAARLATSSRARSRRARVVDAPSAARPPSSPEAGPPETPPTNGDRVPHLVTQPSDGGVPAAAVAAAEELAVPREALEAAWNAYVAGKARTSHGPWGIVPEAEADALRAHGTNGFHAVIALFRGGVSGTWMRDLVAASWTPGTEWRLLDVARDETVAKFSRGSALASLGQVDTATTRAGLVQLLAVETNLVLFEAAARSLATLREPGGSGSVIARLSDRAWSPRIRERLMGSLREMDALAAEAALIDHVRAPDNDLIVEAVRVLRRIDKAVAIREANALLDGSRGPSLDDAVRADLRWIAGRPDDE